MHRYNGSFKSGSRFAVTVFENSRKQLEKDILDAERANLEIELL